MEEQADTRTHTDGHRHTQSYSSITNELHVSIATSLHQNFARICTSRAHFTVFRVLAPMLLLKTISRSRSVADSHNQAFTFIALAGWTPKNLHTCLSPDKHIDGHRQARQAPNIDRHRKTMWKTRKTRENKTTNNKTKKHTHRKQKTWKTAQNSQK